MAIIYSYPEIPDVQGGDLLLISDTGAPNKPTRSVDIDDLAAYIGTVVGVVQNLQSVLTVGNTYVSADGYGTFTLNDIANNDGSITFVNTDEGWGYQISAEEGINITDGSGTNLMSIQSSGLSIRDGAQIMNIGTNALTATRNVYFPDASGTLALTSDIPAPGPSGSGTTNYTARWTSASTLGIGALYDNGTNVGIGTANPTQKLEVNGTVLLSTLPNNNGRLCLGSVNTNLFSNAASGHLYVSTNASTRMTILNNGNVGIGTTSPSAPLNIVNSNPKIVLEDSDNANTFGQIRQQAGNLQFLSNNNTSNGTIQFKLNNGATTVDVMDIISNGNVGIGTTSPSRKLHVHADSGSAYLQLTQAATGTTSNDGFQISMGAAQVNFINRENGNMVFETNNTEKMRITNTGNVGIGTTSPAHKLTINALNDTTAVGIDFPSAHFDFAADSTSGYNTLFKMDDTGLDIGHDSTARALNLKTGNLDRVTILGNGNVGVGTTSPLAKLHTKSGNSGVGSVDTGTSAIIESNTTNYLRFLSTDSSKAGLVWTTPGDNFAAYLRYGYSDQLLEIGTANSNDSISFSTGNASEKMRILSSGNVGIGTTSPSAKLEIAGAGNQKLLINRTDGDNFFIDAQNGQIRMRGSDPIYMGVSGDLLAITNTNVGIGTTSPGSKLHVQGTSFFFDQAIFDDKVGIGTTSPSQKLEVSGNSLVTGTQFIGDTFTKIQQASGNLLLTNQSSSGAIRFLTNSTERVRVDSSGNVGIGTTSPDGVLHIKKDNAPATFEIQGGLNTQTTAGAINGEINFGVNDASTTGGIGASIKNISEISNGAHNGLAFFTGLQSRTPYLQQMLYFTARGGLSFGTTNNSYGTSGQILKSNADAPPSWVNASTVIGGPYLPLAGGTMSGNTNHSDNVKDRYGTGNDFQIWHDGSNTFLSNEGEGHLNIINTGDDRDIVFKTDDGSGATTSYMVIDGSAEQTRFYKDTRHTDGIKANFGDSNDLQIYHDGSNSYIKDNGIGDLRFMASNIKFYDNATAELMAQMIPNGAVELYYNNSKKFETSNTGVSVTGNGIFTGNVGIGTTNPVEKLQINSGDVLINNSTISSLKSGGSLYIDLNTFGSYSGRNFRISDNGTSLVNVTQVGNVGIGTTNPSARLEVFSTTTNKFVRFRADNNEQRFEFYVGASGNPSRMSMYNDAATETIRFASAGNSYINGGNVGIGTTSPGAKLSVNGNVKIEGTNSLLFGGSASVPSWAINHNGSDLLIDDQGGNIGSVLFNNNEGVALPRLTTTQINAISSPAQGLMAYNTTLNTICFYNGSSWQKVSHANM